MYNEHSKHHMLCVDCTIAALQKFNATFEKKHIRRRCNKTASPRSTRRAYVSSTVALSNTSCEPNVSIGAGQITTSFRKETSPTHVMEHRRGILGKPSRTSSPDYSDGSKYDWLIVNNLIHYRLLVEPRQLELKERKRQHSQSKLHRHIEKLKTCVMKFLSRLRLRMHGPTTRLGQSMSLLCARFSCRCAPLLESVSFVIFF